VFFARYLASRELFKVSIFNSDHPEPEIDFYIIQEYYEKGPVMHEMLTSLIKSLKLE